LKMEILTELAFTTNVYDIVTEMTEYARDVVSPIMAREAVKSVGRIALQVCLKKSKWCQTMSVLVKEHCAAVVLERANSVKQCQSW